MSLLHYCILPYFCNTIWLMIEIKGNVPLAPYTIYKIGGPAKFLAEAKNGAELKEALRFAADKQTPFFILGAGSNVLVSDKGFDGLIIRKYFYPS